MINSIVLFGYHSNSFFSNKLTIPYSASVGIQSTIKILYSISPQQNSKIDINYDANGAIEAINKIITVHYTVGEQPTIENVIVRKNDGD